MENTERLAAGQRNSPVGGLQAALGRSRSPRGIVDASPQSSAAALPIILESSPHPVQLSQPTLKIGQQPAAPSSDSPLTELQTASGSGPNLIDLPGLLLSGQQKRTVQQRCSLPTHPQTSPEQCLTTAGTLLTNSSVSTAHQTGDGASSLTRAFVRGSLATAMATASNLYSPAGSAGMNPGCAPLEVGYVHVIPHDSNGNVGGAAVLAAPPAITPLSSSLSQGFRQGLPSWLQESAVQPQAHFYSPSHAQPQVQPVPHPQLQPSPLQQSQQQPHSQQQQQSRRSPFLPSPQMPRRPFHTTPVDTGVVAAAAAAAQQLHLARSLPAGGFGGMHAVLPYSGAPRQILNVATDQGCHLISQQGLGDGALVKGHGSGFGALGRGTAAQLRKESPDEAGVMGDTPGRGTLTRGRSGIPRVASISEIEPVLEVEEPSRQRLSNSLLTRAISIPNAQGDARPRTYRVALAKSHGSHEEDNVTVVLEGVDAGSGGGRGARGGGSTHGSHHSYGSSAGGGGGGGGGVMGAASALSSSLMSSSLLGGLFGSRTAGGGGGGLGRTGGGAGGLVSPDRSVHEADSLPFAGRDRFFQRSNSDLQTSFGSVPTSSLLRSRANASVGSILSKATGGLKTANTKALKRSVSYQQFSSAVLVSGIGAGTGAGGGDATAAAATDMPPSSSGTWLRGRRAPQTFINGGSDSSGACTSTSASAGGGLGSWLRGGSGWGAGAAAGGSRGGCGGAGSDNDGAIVGAVSAARRRAEPDLADLAVLATSLPASLGTWSLPRSMALASSPTTGIGNAIYGSGGAGRRGTMSCGENNANGSAHAGGVAGTPAGPAPPGPGPAGGFPICLICLEVLTPEEFESGDAISLQCACKGEMSLRHRTCAIEWSHHKGDVICDICKQGIANLPPIPPEILAARETARRRRQPAFNIAAEPNLADFCFDCIRATWVTMIVCVLFFDVSIGQAFMLGLLVGLAFMLVSMAIAAFARRARALAAARAVERAAAESRAQEQQQQQRWRQQSQPQHHHNTGSGSGSAAGPSGGSGGGAGHPRGSQGGSGGGGSGVRRALTSEPSLMVPLLAAADVH